MQETTKPVTTASATYTGTPENVSAARRWVRNTLARSPRHGDLELIAAELAANAVQHTPSGQPGGTFTVTIKQGNGWARLEVADCGTPGWSWPACRPGKGGLLESGRGLTIVAMVADRAGHSGGASTPQVTWAEVAWQALDD